MKLTAQLKIGAIALLLSSALAHATGMVPETSVVIVEESDGEGAINVKNTDAFPVLLLTTLHYIPDDNEKLLLVTPPTARVEPGKTQRVRFMMIGKEPLKTERLERVIFEGVPPQKKGKSEVRMTVRQNLPVIIRPANLAKDLEPWKHLTWKADGASLAVSNPSPYVVRLGQGVQTLPANAQWNLPNAYILPGQTISLEPAGKKQDGVIKTIRISPATTWGYTVNNYDFQLGQ